MSQDKDLDYATADSLAQHVKSVFTHLIGTAEERLELDDAFVENLFAQIEETLPIPLPAGSERHPLDGHVDTAGGNIIKIWIGDQVFVSSEFIAISVVLERGKGKIYGNLNGRVSYTVVPLQGNFSAILIVGHKVWGLFIGTKPRQFGPRSGVGMWNV